MTQTMSNEVTLPPCPFCGNTPERISSGTATCYGMVDGKEVHNTISMRPECWRARNTRDTSELLREAAAKRIYDHWSFGTWFSGDKPAWVEGGNSEAQALARTFASLAIDAHLKGEAQ